LSGPSGAQQNDDDDDAGWDVEGEDACSEIPAVKHCFFLLFFVLLLLFAVTAAADV